MERYLCIHGHFYQPPRENPWLEAVEQEDSAAPYHDWNECVCTECYAPNTASRILNQDKKIVEIVNNYSYMSFNIGPTLLNWLQQKQPEIYQKILEADRFSQCRYSGHGAAIAQVYNHLIMPLANRRDKQTQVIWGLRDFIFRFGRKPEGMWLAETAVDNETLEILSQEGILFTILAPHQAHRVRKVGENKWHDVSSGRIDTRMPYLCRLPSGQTISLFFYDTSLSQEASFGQLLSNGENLAKRMCSPLSGARRPSPLGHIALDGETFGHHHSFGDMTLAYFFHYLETTKLAKITVYGEYLEKFPPTYEVEIFENSSWSCSHGVERWRNDCGCCSGNPGWQQRWRAPLRGAMDWLRDSLSHIYETVGRTYFRDPWSARNSYIDCILDRSSSTADAFLLQQSSRINNDDDRIIAFKLLEMQRASLLMYTSCGWFFEEISRLETVQVLRYAARAIQLAKEVSHIDLEPAFLKLLERAPSNIVNFQNGAHVYDVLVKPAIVDLLRVTAHYGVSSLFENYPIHEPIQIYSYSISTENYDRIELGKQRVAIGKAQVTSQITGEKAMISFAILHLGDHNLTGGVRYFRSSELFQTMLTEIKEAFLQRDMTKLIRIMDKHFGNHNYSLYHLFRDQQRKIIQRAFEHTLKNLENAFGQIYDQYHNIMQTFQNMQFPLPKPLAATIEFMLNRELRNLLLNETIEPDQISELLAQLQSQSLQLDKTSLEFIASTRITNWMQELACNPQDAVLLQKIVTWFIALEPCHLELNLWQAQNIYFAIRRQALEPKTTDAKEPKLTDTCRLRWIGLFHKLGQHLEIIQAVPHKRQISHNR